MTATEETQTSLRASLTDAEPSLRRRLARWLCTPSSARLALLDTARSDLKDAERIVAEWNAQASAAIVLGLAGRSVLVQNLRVRADAIANASSDPLEEPKEPGAPQSSRKGLAGLEAVLHEARALATVIAQNRAPRRVQTESFRAGDENHDSLVPIQGALLAAAQRLSGWVGQLKTAGSQHAVATGDYITFGLAIVVVVWTALVTLYVGKGWGTRLDMVGLVIAAVGGSLVLTPLFQAVDRLGGGTGRDGG